MNQNLENDEFELNTKEIEYLIRLVCKDLKECKDNSDISLEKNIEYKCIKQSVLESLCRLAFYCRKNGDNHG